MSQVEDDKTSQTSEYHYDSDVHIDKDGCEFVTREIRTYNPGADAKIEDSVTVVDGTAGMKRTTKEIGVPAT